MTQEVMGMDTQSSVKGRGLAWWCAVLVISVGLVAAVGLTAAPTARASGRVPVTVKATVTQVSKHRVRTKVVVRTAANKAPAGKRVTVRVKAPGQRAVSTQARWVKKGKHWRVVVKTRTRKPAKKVTARGEGVVTTRVRPGRTATKVKVKSPVVAAVGAASAKVRVKVSPAYRRVVRVQHQVAGEWETVAKVRPRGRQATVKVKLTRAELTRSGGGWRVKVPRTRLARKAVTPFEVSVKTRRDTDPPVTGPPLTDPPVTGERWCLDGLSEPIPDCDRLPTVSNVYDRLTINPACGLTINCWRNPTPTEVTWGFDKTRHFGDGTWNKYLLYGPASGGAGSPELNNATATSTLYLPDLVAEMNAFAHRWEDEWRQRVPSYSGVSNQSPFRALWTEEFGGPAMTTPVLEYPDGSTGTITVRGQGGFAQHWAEVSTAGYTETGYWNGVSDAEAHSCGMRSDNTWCTPSVDNNANLAMTAQYPPPAGWEWVCSEQIWPDSPDGTMRGMLNIVRTSEAVPVHYGGIMNGAAGAGPMYVDYGAVQWPGGGAVVVVEMCGLWQPDPNNPLGEAGVLPGDTWP